MAEDGTTTSLTRLRSQANGEIHKLEADIALKRAKVTASLTELRRRVDYATTWRYWAGEYPLVWIAAGISLGLIVGFGGARRRR